MLTFFFTKLRKTQSDGRRFYLGKRGDGGPVWFSYFLSLDDVMCDSRSAVIFWRLPAQSAGVLGDVGHCEAAALAWHRCIATHSQISETTRADNVI